MSRIERSLVILPKPMGLILSGRKTWEMRSRPTRIRGRIGLSESGAGMIVGSAEIVGCLGPLTFEEMRREFRKGGFTPAEFRRERAYWLRETKAQRMYAWVLAKVRRYRRPVRFQNPSGAVIWARIPGRVAARLR